MNDCKGRCQSRTVLRLYQPRWRSLVTISCPGNLSTKRKPDLMNTSASCRRPVASPAPAPLVPADPLAAPLRRGRLGGGSLPPFSAVTSLGGGGQGSSSHSVPRRRWRDISNHLRS
jgi:hypothetical protein